MMGRLIGLPTYSSITTYVDATYFNTIRRALLKTNNTLRIPILELEQVDIIIDHDSWVCINRHNNMPLVAWVDFHIGRRADLHSPIECTKNYYHFGAARIARNALALAVSHLNETMAPAPMCRLQQPQRHWKTKSNTTLVCL